MSIWTIKPGSIAGVVYVVSPTNVEKGVVYYGKRRAVVGAGQRDVSIADLGWPTAVQESVHDHFEVVFATEHESHRGPGLSPRATLVASLSPWTIEVEDEPCTTQTP